MPIVDVVLVGETDRDRRGISARRLADALGDALGSPTGRTWVRLRVLGSDDYAENGTDPAPSEWPVFVTLLHARRPVDEALRAEIAAVTAAVAACTGRAPSRVHVEYAPAGAGRLALGGQLVP